MARRLEYRIYTAIISGQDDAGTSGAAWPNKDGKGFSLKCDAVPLHGRIVMRAYQPKAQAGEGLI
jgi:hypothetical protein